MFLKYKNKKNKKAKTYVLTTATADTVTIVLVMKKSLLECSSVVTFSQYIILDGRFVCSASV